jgi:hypothetical protein
MTTVRVLVDHVGEYMAGDIVTDAPDGLVHMAMVGTVNAGTGKRIAEIVSDREKSEVADTPEAVAILNELTEKAISYGVPEAETLSITELISAIVQAEWDKHEQEAILVAIQLKQKEDQDAVDAAAAEFAELKKQAKELKIEGYTKMDADELKVAIAAAASVGGGSNEQ